jgi:hypothetical protein
MLPLAVSPDGTRVAVASDFGYGAGAFTPRDADGTASAHVLADPGSDYGYGGVAIYDAATGSAVEAVAITSNELYSAVYPYDLAFDSAGGLVLFGYVDQGGAVFPAPSSMTTDARIFYGAILSDDSSLAGGDAQGNGYYGTLRGFVPWGEIANVLWRISPTGSSAP